MKYIFPIVTAIVVSASIVCAQQDEASAKERPGGGARSEMRERMRDRIKSQREGGGEHRGSEMRGEKPGGREGGGERGEMFEHMLGNPEIREKLGLSEEDVSKIKDELYKMKMELIELKAKMEKLGLEQARAMTSKEIDEGELMKLVEKMGKLRTEMAKIQIKKMVLFRKHVDPEKMDKIRGAMRERMQSRHRGEDRPEGKRERSGEEGGQRDGKRRPGAENRDRGDKSGE